MCAAGLHVATMLHGLNSPAALVARVRAVTCLVCSEELEQQGRQALCVWLASHSTIVQGASRWHGGNIGRCGISSLFTHNLPLWAFRSACVRQTAQHTERLIMTKASREHALHGCVGACWV
jgi:hypothetical protein